LFAVNNYDPLQIDFNDCKNIALAAKSVSNEAMKMSTAGIIDAG